MKHESVKLAYLVSRYPAISHTFILREIRFLRENGFDICVASVNDPDRPPAGLTSEEREEAAATYYIKGDGVRGAMRAHLSTIAAHPFAYLSGLAFALRLSGWDIRSALYSFFYFVEAVMIGTWMEHNSRSHLHVHFATSASNIALIARRIFGITFSITVHGPDEFYNVDKHLLREKTEAADFICCIGMYARSQLMALSSPDIWDKFEITPLGVDVRHFSPIAKSGERNKFEIICVGRLVPVKGQQILLEAVKTLIGENRDLTLRLVGDGPDRETLETYSKQNALAHHVIFEGAVNQDRIRELYSTADAFVIASFAEGIPVVLMEAMAMAIPCVTTRITGIPELIRDGLDGLLVAASDVNELSAAIAALMDSPEKRHALGKAGRERVIDRYELGRNTTGLANVFRSRLQPGSIAQRITSHPTELSSNESLNQIEPARVA